MCLQKVLQALKSFLLFGELFFCYALMLWGVAAVVPLYSYGGNKLFSIGTGVVVLLVSAGRCLKVTKAISKRTPLGFIRIVLDALYVLFFCSLLCLGLLTVFLGETLHEMLLSGGLSVYSVFMLAYSRK